MQMREDLIFGQGEHRSKPVLILGRWIFVALGMCCSYYDYDHYDHYYYYYHHSPISFLELAMQGQIYILG